MLDPPGIDAFVCQNAETPASFLPSLPPHSPSVFLFAPFSLTSSLGAFILTSCQYRHLSFAVSIFYPQPYSLTLSIPFTGLLLIPPSFSSFTYTPFIPITFFLFCSSIQFLLSLFFLFSCFLSKFPPSPLSHSLLFSTSFLLLPISL